MKSQCTCDQTETTTGGSFRAPFGSGFIGSSVSTKINMNPDFFSSKVFSKKLKKNIESRLTEQSASLEVPKERRIRTDRTNFKKGSNPKKMEDSSY